MRAGRKQAAPESGRDDHQQRAQRPAGHGRKQHHHGNGGYHPHREAGHQPEGSREQFRPGSPAEELRGPVQTVSHPPSQGPAGDVSESGSEECSGDRGQVAIGRDCRKPVHCRPA